MVATDIFVVYGIAFDATLFQQAGISTGPYDPDVPTEDPEVTYREMIMLGTMPDFGMGIYVLAHDVIGQDKKAFVIGIELAHMDMDRCADLPGLEKLTLRKILTAKARFEQRAAICPLLDGQNISDTGIIFVRNDCMCCS
jgi:hypothetical protein